MRFLILFVSSALAAFYLGIYLPYWGLMIVIALLAALVGGNGWLAFFSAALSVGVVWWLVPVIIISRTGSDLPEKIAAIMGQDQSFLLYAATSLMGFLIAGFSALAGNRFRNLFEKERTNY